MRSLCLSLKEGQDARDEFSQEIIWPIHHNEMMAALKAYEFLVWGHDTVEILLSQFDRRLLVMGAFEEKDRNLEGESERRQILCRSGSTDRYRRSGHT